MKCIQSPILNNIDARNTVEAWIQKDWSQSIWNTLKSPNKFLVLQSRRAKWIRPTHQTRLNVFKHHLRHNTYRLTVFETGSKSLSRTSTNKFNPLGLDAFDTDAAELQIQMRYGSIDLQHLRQFLAAWNCAGSSSILQTTHATTSTHLGPKSGSPRLQKLPQVLELFQFLASPEHLTFPVLRATAPDLDAFDLNPAFFQIQVRHVAVALQSFRQDLHLAALRRGRNGQRLAAPRLHGGNIHASVAIVFSGEVQLHNAGLVQDTCQRLAIQSSKKLLHFYWNDLMILFHPFSIFACFH